MLQKACFWWFVAGGLWTCAASESAGDDINPTCPMCGAAVDSPFHRVWESMNPEISAAGRQVAGALLADAALSVGGGSLLHSRVILTKSKLKSQAEEQSVER